MKMAHAILVLIARTGTDIRLDYPKYWKLDSRCDAEFSFIQLTCASIQLTCASACATPITVMSTKAAIKLLSKKPRTLIGYSVPTNTHAVVHLAKHYN